MSTYTPAWRKEADAKYAARQGERADALARDFYEHRAVRMNADGENCSGWLSVKRSDYLGGLTRDSGYPYGYFDLDDGRRFEWQIGPRSPLNGCRVFSVKRVPNAAEWAEIAAKEDYAAETKTIQRSIFAAVNEYIDTGDVASAKILIRASQDIILDRHAGTPA